MAQPNVRLRVTATVGKEKDYKELFRRIVLDYCKRFKVRVKRAPWEVSIVVAHYQNEDGATGATSPPFEGEHRIVVQVREPYTESETPNSEIINHTFFAVVCHEFVHCCQILTGREGIALPQLIIPGEKDNLESYQFDPAEIEARVLDEYYIRYVPDSLRAAVREVNAKET
jgi:hypothetical protein